MGGIVGGIIGLATAARAKEIADQFIMKEESTRLRQAIKQSAFETQDLGVAQGVVRGNVVGAIAASGAELGSGVGAVNKARTNAQFRRDRIKLRVGQSARIENIKLDSLKARAGVNAQHSAAMSSAGSQLIGGLMQFAIPATRGF